MQRPEVLVIQSVAGIDLKSELMRPLRAGNQSLQLVFAVRGLVERLRKCARMKLNELRTETRRSFDLLGIRSDEQTDFNASVLHPLACLRQRLLVSNHIESALS